MYTGARISSDTQTQMHKHWVKNPWARTKYFNGIKCYSSNTCCLSRGDFITHWMVVTCHCVLGCLRKMFHLSFFGEFDDEQTCSFLSKEEYFLFTERYLSHYQCLCDLVNYWFRVPGDRKHKLVCNLVLRGSLDILKPVVVRCRGQDIYEKQKDTAKPHSIWTKKVFIPEPLSVIINTWTLGQHPSVVHEAHTQTQST